MLAGACATSRPDPAQYVPGMWPTPPDARQVSSSYGSRVHPMGGGRRFHSGIDIAAPKGTPAMATARGRVAYTGRDRGGYGKYVTVNHGNGYETLYAHLSRIKTKRGKRVDRGEVIGRVGTTGRSTGPHLHYEVRRDGTPTDPALYLP